ncbi:MAG TPA: DMSO/selenate family reductase complex B subunit [Symbiobacteriaceae bacterium]|jgi:anaerobic dimethyl sulfoxide reductase subunit B (iron-sulfur subunit)
MATQQLGFHVDMSVCLGCRTCTIACKDKNDLEVGQLYRKVIEVEGGDYTVTGKAVIPNVFAYWISISCNHCAEPRCLQNCPTGAITKREQDGVVTIDQDVCIGCRYCTWSCPYDAPQYNPAKGTTGKCNLCVDLIEKGREPACVAACPVRAIHVGPIAELKKQFGGTMQVKSLPDPALTKPNSLYTPHRDAVRGDASAAPTARR